MRIPSAAVSSALVLAALPLVAVPAAAQFAPGHAVVATLVQGQTTLLDVDLATGAVVVQPRFPSDGRPPLAVVLDPVDGRAVVAIDRGGHTFVHRVGPQDERLLADVPGAVTDLALGDGGDVFATVGGAGGGLWRIPRNGSVPALVVALPRASALTTYGLASPYAWVAESGSATPPLDPAARIVDLRSGATLAGPYVYTGFTPRDLTGIADLPTGAPRQLLTDAGGNVNLSFGFGVPMPLQLMPQLPPGATRCLVMKNAFDGVVLGGAAHPYLKQFTGYQSPQNWVLLAGPLPGDPVDFDLVPAAGAGLDLFGLPCPGSYTPHLWANGAPDLGNASFALTLQGPASTAAALALGGSEQVFLGQLLPLPIPGGCLLRVAPLLLLPGATDAAGNALLPLPVPADPALRGSTVFAQWLLFPASSITASEGAALHLW